MVRDTIHQHHLEILASHPLGPRSKDAVFEFIANFEPERKTVWIQGKYYNITPTVVVEALRCKPYYRDDEQLEKEWTKDYGIETTFWALEESQCYDGQTKWQNKKEKF